MIKIDYQILTSEDGKVFNIDTTAEIFVIALPAPTSGFKCTIKDATGNANINMIVVTRNSINDKIDGEVNNDLIVKAFGSISYLSDGTQWYRVSSFVDQGPNVGMFFGGENGINLSRAEQVNIQSKGSSAFFGSLTVAKYYVAGVSSAVRAFSCGGYVSPTDQNSIEVVSYASLGNFAAFTTLQAGGRRGMGCHSSSTRALLGGGAIVNTEEIRIEYLELATQSQAVAFGNLTAGRSYPVGSGSQTRAVFAGGSTNASVIDYSTITTLATATAFGSLLTSGRGMSAVSSNTRACFTTIDNGFIKTIDYITIATTGNSLSFAQLTVARANGGAASNKVKGVIAAGYNGAPLKVQDWFDIAILADAEDFGTLSVTAEALGGTSNCHGGI